MKINQEAYKEIIKGIDEINPFKKIKEKIEDYPPHNILSIGRDYAKNSKYLEAKIAFDRLEKTKGFEDLSNLYQKIILSLSSLKFRKIVHSRGYDNESLVNSAIHCMVESKRMYSEKEISKQDLFTIETLIDRIPFKTIFMKDRDEFEKLYFKFKEYNLEVFSRG